MRRVEVLPTLEGTAKGKTKVPVDKQIKLRLRQLAEQSKKLTASVKQFEFVETAPDLLAIAKKSGDDWVNKLHTLLGELRVNLDRIQVASIGKNFVIPTLRKEIERQMETKVTDVNGAKIRRF
jgi:hypothetical protein